MLKPETSFSVDDFNIVNTHIMLLGDGKLGNSVNDHLFSLVYVLVLKKIPKILITYLHLYQNGKKPYGKLF